jgi:hypothetical protein
MARRWATVRRILPAANQQDWRAGARQFDDREVPFSLASGRARRHDLQVADKSNDFERLVGNITEELRAQNTGFHLGLPLERIEQMARQIAVNIDYAFRIEWSPRWEGDRRPP